MSAQCCEDAGEQFEFGDRRGVYYYRFCTTEGYYINVGILADICDKHVKEVFKALQASNDFQEANADYLAREDQTW